MTARLHRVHQVLIDSRDRESPDDTSSSQYRITLPVRLRNVVSARLVSAEIPSSFYVFTQAFGNTSLHCEIDGVQKSIAIPDGNYTAASLAVALKTALMSAFNPFTFRVTVSASTLRITIECLEGYDMILDTTSASEKVTEWGLAYYLGFEKNTVYSGPSITSPRVVSPNPYSYLVLDVEELNGVHEGSPDGGGMAAHGCLAKLPLNTNSFDYMFVDTQNVSHSPVEFSPPIQTLERLRVAFRFHDGRVVDFQSLENSFTLELVTREPGGESMHTSTNLPANQPRVPHKTQEHDPRIMQQLATYMKSLEHLTMKQCDGEESFRKKLWIVIAIAGALALYALMNASRRMH